MIKVTGVMAIGRVPGLIVQAIKEYALGLSLDFAVQMP
jgi:hypothetical protein